MGRSTPRSVARPVRRSKHAPDPRPLHPRGRAVCHDRPMLRHRERLNPIGLRSVAILMAAMGKSQINVSGFRQEVTQTVSPRTFLGVQLGDNVHTVSRPVVEFRHITIKLKQWGSINRWGPAFFSPL